MPWLLCLICGGTEYVPVNPDAPDGPQKECPDCKGSSYPGHVYREAM